MKLIYIFVAAASVLLGQTGLEVNVSPSPPITPYTTLIYYDGSSNAEYICKARPIQTSFSWTRSGSTLTSIVVLTNVGTVTTSSAHGLSIGNKVTVSGASVDTDLNGTYVIQTVGSSTTFTITTSAVANATYTESTLAVATTAPRTTVAIWNVQRMIISSNLTVAVLNAGGKSGMNSICANRATLDYE